MAEPLIDSPRAIKILTLDGGGIQGLSTLTILSDVCNAIAAEKGTSVKPAPYELFDVIAGIGTGGWLALLLGRYRLDIVKATLVYMEIAEALDPKTTVERTVSKYKTHARLDQRKLVAKIEEILHKYHLDEHLLDNSHPGTTQNNDTCCQYTFAAGVIKSSKPEEPPQYQLFRTYIPRDEKSEFYCAGPDPAKCRISAACAATGAAKGVLQPYTIGPTFFDSRFPDPHPLSILAVNEAFHMYGKKPNLSVVLSIGPGIPTDNDLREYGKLSRKFSWPARNPLLSFQRKRKEDTRTAQSVQQQAEQGLPRAMTFNSWKSSSSSSSNEETRLQMNIRKKLGQEYGDENIYCRLGPLRSHDRLSLNDVTAVNVSNEEIKLYLDKPDTKKLIREAATRYLTSTLAVVAPVA